MESEYQVKYPMWIAGKGEYVATKEKSKLLAYASKCHTPIFGEPSPKEAPVKKEPKLQASDYVANHEKKKLLAYASKCHTPIFGEPVIKADPVKEESAPLERVATNPILRDVPEVKNQHKKKRTTWTPSASKVKMRARSASPQKHTRKPIYHREIRCVPGVKRKTGVSLTMGSSAYLKLLCNVDNVRPVNRGISNFGK